MKSVIVISIFLYLVGCQPVDEKKQAVGIEEEETIQFRCSCLAAVP